MGNAGIDIWPPNSVSKYVDRAFPFNESFWVYKASLYAILNIEILTAYDLYSSSAQVSVNIQNIGIIEPRPMSRYQDPQPYSIMFSTGLFTPPAPYTGKQRLTIRAMSQNDWLIVGKWWVQYNSGA